MPGAWEILNDEEIRARTRTNRLTALASGNTTLVSGAVSGEIKHIFSVEAKMSGNTQYMDVYISNVDASGTATVIRHGNFVSGNTDLVKELAPGEKVDPKKPFWTLYGDARLDARASVSGLVDVIATWWLE